MHTDTSAAERDVGGTSKGMETVAGNIPSFSDSEDDQGQKQVYGGGHDQGIHTPLQLKETWGVPARGWRLWQETDLL